MKETAHVHTGEVDRVCLVLPQAPAQGWAVDAVRDVFGVCVIWRAESGWKGPDVERVFG